MSYTANIIPTMTSATAPSGVASASGSLAAWCGEWRAFDHLNGADGVNAWFAAAGMTGWLGYQFPVAHVITQYAVTTVNNGTTPRAPKTWTFKGSNNGSTWVTLDTQTNITDWATSPNVRKVFNIGNLGAWAYYRLDITASNDANYVGIGELEMMETAVVINYTANLIPTMTSNTAPSGVVTADSQYDANRASFHAFDHANGDFLNNWCSASTSFPHWLAYEFPVAHVITEYTITVRPDSAAAYPSAWTFEGYNGSTWNVLDTKSGITSWTSGEKKTYPVANSTPYTKYRLNFSAGQTTTLVAIGELEMMETAAPVIGNVIPAMTSNTAPSGVASASSAYPGWAAWCAFDNTASAWSSDANSPQWLAYQFATNKIVKQYTITAAANANGSPTAFKFQGSTNGTTWDDLDTRTGLSWANSEKKTFAVNNATAYAYYKLAITACVGNSLVNVTEWEMMEVAEPAVTLLDASGTIELAGASDLTGFFAVVGLDASGTIELAGSADIFGFSAVVGMDASGSISLAGSASIVLNLAFLEADGTISLEGEYADLTQWEPMAAVGTIALCGEAWLSDALHGDDTLQAIGTIMLRCRAVRLSTGEVLPPTDDLGWTEP